MDVVLYEDSAMKNIRSLNYNVTFYKDSGLMYRWGKTKEDDPIMSPTGPEILDLEISVDGCNGAGNGPCKFCYKSNTNRPSTNMTLETFKKIINKFPCVDAVEIQFDNDEIVKLSNNFPVPLKNGKIKFAVNLTIEDDVDDEKIRPNNPR